MKIPKAASCFGSKFSSTAISEALRQAILKKAFSGQLVPQDPNDEPASVLLERIKAGRIKQAAQVKPRANKKMRRYYV